MPTLFAEPDSPVLYYDTVEEDEEEPHLEGLRNLSVSTDGTIESLVSLDENPTPPHSPNPIVQITPPGASFHSSTGSHFLDLDDAKHDLDHDKTAKWARSTSPFSTTLSLPPQSPSLFLPPLASYSDIPPTPDAVKIAFPSHPSPVESPTTLASRRAASGKLPNKALLSLQQMRFEASNEAGMGLGVGPGSAGFEGMEGISPGEKPGMTFRLAMGFNENTDKDNKTSYKSPLLTAPGLENDGRTLRRSGSTGSLRPSRSRSPLRSNRPYSYIDRSCSPSSMPSSPRPSSPVVKRSSAFFSTSNGPLTPLTPSHIPGAPNLASGSPSCFEWFSFSTPDSPAFPPSSITPHESSPSFIPQFDKARGPVKLPLTPTSESGSITPTSQAFTSSTLMKGGSYHHRSHSHQSTKMPASPLGRGRFEDSVRENPFFA